MLDLLTSHGPRRYPSLAEMLTYCQQRANDQKVVLDAFDFILIGVGTVLLFSSFSAVGGAALVMACALIGSRFFRAMRRPVDPDAQRKRRATEIASQMNRLFKTNRLHRVIGVDSVKILEESANQWLRGRRALGGTFWQSAGLPAPYQSAHGQALRALDSTADELMSLFEYSVMEDNGKTEFPEVVEDVLDKFVFRGTRIQPMHPGFDQARELCHQLAFLADEVENLNQIAVDGLEIPELGARGALELSITEFRQIQKAENELRQDH